MSVSKKKIILVKSVEGFSDNKSKKVLLDCIMASKSMAIFPENADYIEKNGKRYVTNMKITLAKKYCDKGVKTTLTSKTLNLYKINQAPFGWWASEKFDGIRCIWDGAQFISRDGKMFSYVPKNVSDKMPKSVALDGELWIGRNKFQTIVGISNLKPGGKYTQMQIDTLWDSVKFMVFDIPSHNGVFEERMDFGKKLIPKIKSTGNTFTVQWTLHVKVNDEDQLSSIYSDLTTNGAEGVMLRAPNTPYIKTRTNLLLKLKLNEDAEAVVIGYCDGTGKYDKLIPGTKYKMLGSLQCHLIEDGKLTGIKFNVGTGFTDAMRTEYRQADSKYCIKLGSLINFSYMEKTEANIPRHPSFRGIREDLNPIPQAVIKDSEINIFLVDSFKKLIVQLKTNKEPNWNFKVGSYNKAIDCISSSNIPISTVEIALQEFRKCGSKLHGEEAFYKKHKVWKSSILTKINEMLSTGKLTAVESDPKLKTIQQLTKVANIGEAKAASLYDSGIDSIDTLRKKVKIVPNLLTAAQKIGLLYYEDLLLRIPRSEMEDWNTLLLEQAKIVAHKLKIKNYEALLTGSFRRNTKDSGDIDVLLSTDGDYTELFKSFSKHLNDIGVIKTVISSGKSLTFSVAKLPNYSIHRRLDIFGYSPDVYPFALLHSTGSDVHNKKIRAVAKDKGLSLSQYGFKKNNKLLVTTVKSEKDIFDYLELNYVEPQNRN